MSRQLYGGQCKEKVLVLMTLCDPVDHSLPGSIAFSRQEYWSELPCPLPGDLPNLGIELRSLMSPTLAGGFFTTNATWEAHFMEIYELVNVPYS